MTPDGKQVLMMTAGQNPRFVDWRRPARAGGRSAGTKRHVTVAALSRDGKVVLTASGRRVE